MRKVSRYRSAIAFSIVFLGTALGLLLGYFAGFATALSVAHSKVTSFALHLSQQGELSSAESRTILARLNDSPYVFCSNEELEYFRSILIHTEYLKDVGRFRDGAIHCSAMHGRFASPQQMPRPDFTQPDKTNVYVNLPLIRFNNLTVVSLQLSQSYVVFSPYILMHLEPTPIQYTMTVIDAPSGAYGRLLGGIPEEKGELLTNNSKLRTNNMLYATQCSQLYFNCVTAYLSDDAALHMERRSVVSLCSGGALAGAALGSIVALIFLRNRSLEYQLRRAIRDHSLRLEYQPIVDISTQLIIGAEALIRWTDENGALQGADVVVKTAEKNGFIRSMTDAVMHRALTEFGSLLKTYPEFRLHINVTAWDLTDPEFPATVQRHLIDADCSDCCLTIELTESSTADISTAKEAIKCLRNSGHRISIDDFGTGYSSLSYLQDLEVDEVKIDRSFTNTIGTDAVTAGILPQIISLADALKLEMVVEGIETPAQMAYCLNAGPNIYGQGWLFGRATTAAEFKKLWTHSSCIGINAPADLSHQ